MKSIKAPRTSVSRNAGSIPALLLLGALSGTAIAATDIQEPCPETASHKDVLRAFATDETGPRVRTIEASEAAVPAVVSDAEDTTSAEAEEQDDATPQDATPAYTTRLPGVSANDMPGFRRHMYRTDI